MTEEQHDLLERFGAAFNSIEKALKRQSRAPKAARFVDCLSRYEETHRMDRNTVSFLKSIAQLRNVLVHEKTTPRQQLAIPAEEVVTQMERILENLLNPPRVLPMFQGKVESIQWDASLKDVLTLIESRDYSQFPVFEQDLFKGLLTENGITRWLASHVSKSESLVEFEDARVHDILQHEEHRQNYQFVSRECTLDNAATLFRKQDLLEAIFITHSGKPTERHLGIMTRWDLINSGPES